MKKLDEVWLREFDGVFRNLSARECYRFMRDIIPQLHNQEEAMISCKRRVRYLNKKVVDSLDANRVIKDYGDGVIYREVLSATTMDDAEREFEDYHRKTCIPSIYDCTGQLFTEWYRIFHINGRYVLYHSVGMDVQVVRDNERIQGCSTQLSYGNVWGLGAQSPRDSVKKRRN